MGYVVTSSFFEYVKKDLQGLPERGKPVNVNPLLRARVKKVSPEELHANPDDEFSMGTIGPNDSIISNYCQIARREYSLSEAVYDEPIIVNKLERDGYLILNGHHRWAGAIMAHVPKVRIAIVNPGRR